MEQFEKWWEKNKKTWSYPSHNKQDCELAWRAALEWMRSRVDGGCDFTSLEITDIIDEELGNDKES